MQQPEFIISNSQQFGSSNQLYYNSLCYMPKIQFNYQGQSHTLVLTPDQTTRDHILELIKNQWNLTTEQYCLTYADSDGDQISVDTQDDFDVARETMADPNADSLTFKLNLAEGALPIFKPQPATEEKFVIDSSLIKEAHQQDKKQEELPTDARKPEIAQPIEINQIDTNNQVASIEPKEKINQPSEVANKNQQAIALKKAQQAELAEKKKAEKEAAIAARAKAKQEAQQKRREREAALRQAQRLRKQAKQAQKKAQKQEAEQKKKAAKLIKTEVVPKSEQKQKEEGLSSSEQKQKTQSKPKQSPKYNLADLSVSSLDAKMTENRVRQLIREEVMNMIPELKTKILEKEVPLPLIQKKGIPCESKCSSCKIIELKVPFYFNPETRAYICQECEAHETSSTPLLKIRDQQHFLKNFFTFAGVVTKEEVEVGEQLTFEKCILNAKQKIITKIKDDLKRKDVEHRKKTAQDKPKQVNNQQKQ